jgi:hypothetical protein
MALPITETREKIAALREQIAYLLSPGRRTGPSVYEVEDTVTALRLEADTLTESLFWEMAEGMPRSGYLHCKGATS